MNQDHLGNASKGANDGGKSSLWEPVIGLELHVQLNTKTKLFCSCPNQYGGVANTFVCPVCLAHTGTLPLVNEQAVKKALKISHAIKAKINLTSYFERKGYFYPDLPKAYQISQLNQPICVGGSFSFFVGHGDNGYEKTVEIERIQIEEDAGKLIHAEDGRGTESYVDFNRAGAPLCEIVSKPQIYSAQEAADYMRAWREFLLYLGVSHANMQEGNLRCDANVSLRPRGSDTLGTRTEIKNMNTFKGIEAAINYEIKRQSQLLDKGQEVEQQTLLFDALKKKTFPMRSKEDASDYRYFPDPDLPPLVLDEKMVSAVCAEIEELPREKNKRFCEEYGLSLYDAWLMAHNKLLAKYYEKAIDQAKRRKSTETPDEIKKLAKKVCNWVSTEVLSVLNEKDISIEDFSIAAEQLGDLVGFVEKGDITGKIAKTVFAIMLKTGDSPEKIIKDNNFSVVRDEGLIVKYVDDVMANNPKAVADFRAGNEKILGFLVGQVMKLSKGQADPARLQELLRKRLNS